LLALLLALLLLSSRRRGAAVWASLPIPAADFCALVARRRQAGKTVPGSMYGPRVVDGVPGFHAGQDLPAPAGTPVIAVADGIVTEVAEGASGGVFIRYETAEPSGRVSVMHLARGSVRVVVGEIVVPGQHIADVGFTGRVSPPGPAGAHLHIEWKPTGSAGAVDPLPMFPIPEDCPL
jgi:murein DD-endopeptidase MepM/ murein hydrolase activator NlpD